MRLTTEALGADTIDDSGPNADQVIACYWERAYRFAAMVARNKQDTSDIAQDALALAIRRLEQFDPDRGQFESWLWRIVLNVAQDAGRASARRASLPIWDLWVACGWRSSTIKGCHGRSR